MLWNYETDDGGSLGSGDKRWKHIGPRLRISGLKRAKVDKIKLRKPPYLTASLSFKNRNLLGSKDVDSFPRSGIHSHRKARGESGVNLDRVRSHYQSFPTGREDCRPLSLIAMRSLDRSIG